VIEMLNIKEEIASLEEELIVLRRDFHMHPELGYQEFETSRKVKEYLESLGLEVSTVAKTGVVGLLRGGDQSSGKTVLLRSDMDALPVKEATSLPYQSKKIGVMHACGHDGHMAIQLIAAKILSKHKGRIKRKCKIYIST
jgi:amidohydrolase